MGMKACQSPVRYFISGNRYDEWVLFIHAAFADHTMFKEQITYFQNRYNLIAVDIIGHGQSTQTRKGDSIISSVYPSERSLRRILPIIIRTE